MYMIISSSEIYDFVGNFLAQKAYVTIRSMCSFIILPRLFQYILPVRYQSVRVFMPLSGDKQWRRPARGTGEGNEKLHVREGCPLLTGYGSV